MSVLDSFTPEERAQIDARVHELITEASDSIHTLLEDAIDEEPSDELRNALTDDDLALLEEIVG